ncbi:LacI family DNA-binding transcriptional regulator [Micromonospora sp. LZ34]
MKLAEERQAAILRAIELRGVVHTAEIAERLGVSPVTIRRDITALADRGFVRRIHGGAVSVRTATRPGSTTAPPPRATLGLMLPSATYYYAAVIRGAEAAAAARGVRLVLAITNYLAEEDRRQLARLLDVGVDGLLLSTSEAPDRDPELASWLAAVPVPVVLVERRVDLPQAARIGHVRTDHAGGARLALHHLASLGHSSVAIATREGSPTTRWLLDGHAAAVAQGVFDPGGPEPVLLPLSAENPAVRHGALEALLDRCAEHGTTAVLVHNDEDAIALLQVARVRGLSVPADLAVVAYDDEVAALADVPLTAVAPPKSEVGRLAVETLMQQLTGPPEQPVQHVSLLPRLMIRASTDGPR